MSKMSGSPTEFERRLLKKQRRKQDVKEKLSNEFWSIKLFPTCLTPYVQYIPQRKISRSVTGRQGSVTDVRYGDVKVV